MLRPNNYDNDDDYDTQLYDDSRAHNKAARCQLSPINLILCNFYKFRSDDDDDDVAGGFY